MARLGGNPQFHAFNVALGSNEAMLPFHLAADTSESRLYGDVTSLNTFWPHQMPQDLTFAQTMEIQVTRLSECLRRKLVPEDISLVKIDTEGFDLEVVKGADAWSYPLVCMEFWDAAIPFSESTTSYSIEDAVMLMRSHGYFWHVVIYRVWGKDLTAFYCNSFERVPHSWGNIIFDGVFT